MIKTKYWPAQRPWLRIALIFVAFFPKQDAIAITAPVFRAADHRRLFSNTPKKDFVNPLRKLMNKVLGVAMCALMCPYLTDRPCGAPAIKEP